MPPPDRYIDDLGALLQDQAELDRIGAEIVSGGHGAFRYRENRADGKSMVFVARHDDVVSVLTDEDHYSLAHYNPLFSAAAPVNAIIIMRPQCPERTERVDIVRAAEALTPWFGEDPTKRRALARNCVDEILKAVQPRGQFDLIGEYGFFAPYLIAKHVLGLPQRPSWDLIAMIPWLANSHSMSAVFAPDTRAYLTELAWSEFVVAQLLRNFENRTWVLRILAQRGARKMREQMEGYIDRYPKGAGAGTLLHALWAVREDFPKIEDDRYREHVVSIMMELGGTLLLVPGSAFSGIIERWRAPNGPGLHQSLRQLGAMDAEAFVQEELRLEPTGAQLLRNATRPLDLGGIHLETDEYVCAMVKAAGTDVPRPDAVQAGRPGNTYLHFGPEGGPHRCFGSRLAPSILAEMFLGLTRLPQLRPRGHLVSRLGMVPGRLMVDFG